MESGTCLLRMTFCAMWFGTPGMLLLGSSAGSTSALWLPRCPVTGPLLVLGRGSTGRPLREHARRCRSGIATCSCVPNRGPYGVLMSLVRPASMKAH
eukprot:11452981-Alexandrium_andersonii.AAC.1